MSVKYTNNAATTLASGINNSATSLSVTSASGFPSLPSSLDYFYVTLDDGTNNEIVKVTAVSGTTFTIVRAQDDTTARAFSADDDVELRLNAAVLSDVVSEYITNTFTRDAYTGDGSEDEFTLSASPSSENDLLVFIEGVFQTQSAYSLSGNTLTFSTPPANTREIIVYFVRAAVSGSNLNHDQFTASGSAAFTLSISPINENNTQVFIDGVYQQKTDYSTSGSTLTFDTAPATGGIVEVVTFTQTDINVPTDDSVSEVKLNASNSPTNGYFLSAQSGNTGGLTWAEANNYVHPNHSGEVTSSADGATVIVDNIVDEANLKVSNSPTNGYFLSAQSGNTGGLTWAEVDTSTLAPLASPTFTGNPVAPTQSASNNSTRIATTAYADTAVANIVDSAPSTLNTLNELAAALGDDVNFSTTITNSIALKAPLASPTFTGNVGLPDDSIDLAHMSDNSVDSDQYVDGSIDAVHLAPAQTNITSLGTLTTLTVDNVIINGSTIGHTGDTDLMTVASGVLTVAGEVSMTTLDIGGTNVTSTAAELNYVDGVTSAIQTQMDTKASTGKAIAMAMIFG